MRLILVPFILVVAEGCSSQSTSPMRTATQDSQDDRDPLPETRDQRFFDQNVVVEGHRYVTCTFQRCNIELTMNPWELLDCTFDQCSWRIVADVSLSGPGDSQLGRLRQVIEAVETSEVASPNGLGAMGTPASIVLDWDDRSSNDVGFEIRRVSAGGIAYFLKDNSDVSAGPAYKGERTFIDKQVVSKMIYNYAVRAKGPRGTYSKWSNVAAAQPKRE